MSRSGDWYIKENKDEDDDSGYDAWKMEQAMLADARKEAVAYVQEAWTALNKVNFLEGQVEHNLDFHKAIWDASTELLPGLEVQVVIDANNEAHVSTGSPGYVDFQINPVGMKLPIKCWIHTHPFGAAYFSGTDIRTVSIWEPRMHSAYVLGGIGHWGYWEQGNPKELQIFKEHEFVQTQSWAKRGEEE